MSCSLHFQTKRILNACLTKESYTVYTMHLFDQTSSIFLLLLSAMSGISHIITASGLFLKFKQQSNSSYYYLIYLPLLGRIFPNNSSILYIENRCFVLCTRKSEIITISK